MLWAGAQPALWPHLPPCVRALGCGSSKNPPSRGTRSAANSFRLPSSLSSAAPAARRVSFTSARPSWVRCDSTSARVSSAIRCPNPPTASVATNSTVSSSNTPQTQARKWFASTGPPPPRELQLSSPPAAGPSLHLATGFLGSRPTSAAPSTTTWNSTSSKTATSGSAPSKTAPPTFAVSLRSESSDPSAFTPGDLLRRCAPLSERLRALTRTMGWLITGPLVLSERLSQPADEVSYRAGDSLGFIDSFTGSGILNAMLTGELAGIAAALGAPAASYLRDCRRPLRRPFLVSSVFRTIIASGHAGLLASLVPGRLLFHATRPSGLKLGA